MPTPSSFCSVLSLVYLTSQKENPWHKEHKNQTTRPDKKEWNLQSEESTYALNGEFPCPPKKGIFNSEEFWSKFKDGKIYIKIKATTKK